MSEREIGRCVGGLRLRRYPPVSIAVHESETADDAFG